ncbi:MAG: hypothetical protein QJT81_02885 [Candidatus Thiothrix putei]|uniref:SNF2 N-terminal domain-containing protein n=1 Tax=Candidatus Thiothrix putei TaxID=3080811 RepID=A0AA95HCJ9_9GAMM|nr:MAG: hypothetical protein QJT81_02885 [Candidatus Thiothrix putei]
MFAYENPLSKGVILADEIGLGKTIEAGFLSLQKPKLQTQWAIPKNHRNTSYNHIIME